MSEAESVLNWVSMTSRMRTVSTSLCTSSPWCSMCAPMQHERAHDAEPQVAEQQAGEDQGDGDPLAQAAAEAPTAGTEPCGSAGRAAAILAFGRAFRGADLEDAAAIQWQRGQKIDGAEQKIQPDHGAQQIRRRDPGLLR